PAGPADELTVAFAPPPGFPARAGPESYRIQPMKRAVRVIASAVVVLLGAVAAVPAGEPKPAAQETDAEALVKLSKALTLHASFDKGLDADFCRGDKMC